MGGPLGGKSAPLGGDLVGPIRRMGGRRGLADAAGGLFIRLKLQLQLRRLELISSPTVDDERIALMRHDGVEGGWGK